MFLPVFVVQTLASPWFFLFPPIDVPEKQHLGKQTWLYSRNRKATRCVTIICEDMFGPCTLDALVIKAHGVVHTLCFS